MNRSDNAKDDLIAEAGALQHGRAPRPLPLFLDLVRNVAERDPELARRALFGLRRYQEAERAPAAPPSPAIARVGSASLRDYGGDGPPAVLVPSLINPPGILDLDPETSLAAAVRAMGRRPFLIDWGPAGRRQDLDVAGHVTELLVPLTKATGSAPALIGYCLGGTMAIAAANLVAVERVATLAAPWNFDRYPAESRAALDHIWTSSRAGADAFHALPIEVLQAAFWSLDPVRTVRKFADFGELAADDPRARRFVALEDWANDGEPVPFPAARELIEDLFGENRSGSGRWSLGPALVTDRIDSPLLNITASDDRIAPASTASSGPSVTIESGHVGMVVGSARAQLHSALREFLAPSRA